MSSPLSPRNFGRYEPIGSSKTGSISKFTPPSISAISFSDRTAYTRLDETYTPPVGPEHADIGLTTRKRKDILLSQHQLWRYIDKLNRVITDWWLFELLSWLVSMISLTTIVVVLLVYHNRPIPEWPLSITLNSIISILSTIAKAALIMPVAESISQLKWVWFTRSNRLIDFQTIDGASRGPLGSIKLLKMTKCMNLVSLGAVVTLAALAIEPFLQQVVTYPSVPIASAQAFIARSEAYDLYELSIPFQPVLSMRTAVEGAILTGYASAITHPVCTSGNCNWKLYSTLGVCSSCYDITDTLIKTSNCSTGSVDMSGCTYVLQNGTNSDTIVEPLRNGYANASGGMSISTSTMFEKNTSIIGLISLFLARDPRAMKPKLYATSCTLDFCIKKIDSSVVDGSLTENVLSIYANGSLTVDNVPSTPSPASTSPSPVLQEPPTGYAVEPFPMELPPPDIGHVVDPFPLEVPAPDMGAGLGNGPTVDLTPLEVREMADDERNMQLVLNDSAHSDCVTISGTTLSAFHSYLSSLFNGTAISLPGGLLVKASTAAYSNDIIGALFIAQNTSQSHSTPINPLPGLEALMKVVATSMTNNIRNNGNGTGSALGKVWITTSIVHVRWIWLTVPLLLNLAAFVFIVATMRHSQASQTPIWKSSAIAPILHGLSADHHATLSNGTIVTEMETAAENMKISFRPSDDGWRFASETKTMR